MIKEWKEYSFSLANEDIFTIVVKLYKGLVFRTCKMLLEAHCVLIILDKLIFRIKVNK